MGKIILQPTAIAQWHCLVKEAEHSNRVCLCEELESYLIFLLIRFTNKPELARSVLALEFLESTQSNSIGAKQAERLREVGDKCLLFAGLFPGRAQRKRVHISYFVGLGQSAYGAVAASTKQQLVGLYTALGQRFVTLMDVLQVMREQMGKEEELSLLQAEELWQDVASRHALEVLHRKTKGLLIPYQVLTKEAKH